MTGTVKGHLLLWKGKSMNKSIEAHKGACYALTATTNPLGLVSGGADGFLNFINDKFESWWKFDINSRSEFKSIMPKIRAIATSTGQTLAVGTRGGEIVQFNLTGQSEDHIETKVILRGHFDYELWGLSVHPTQPVYATVGEDFLLAIWEIQTRRQSKAVRLSVQSKVCQYSNDGKYLAVGCKNGSETFQHFM